LGFKQVAGDPWDKVEEKYKPGMILTGKITRMVEFGAFMELEKMIEGLIHRTEISNPPPKKLEDSLKVGQEATAKVLAVDTGKRRISLSLKALLKPEAKKPTGDDPEIVQRKTGAFQKMLKKFFKNAKAENEDDEDY
jgi:4-hydroxy-3-methylbut-2-enyl diphosphate reductase